MQVDCYDFKIVVLICELSNIKCVRVHGKADISETGLKGFGQLINLESAIFGKSLVTDSVLAMWGNLTKLKNLDLSDTLITDSSLPYLELFTKLEKLFLHRTKISGNDFGFLSSFPYLQKICLNAGLITPNAVDQLQMIAEKRLNNPEIVNPFCLVISGDVSHHLRNTGFAIPTVISEAQKIEFRQQLPTSIAIEFYPA
jgi:hypothetical protein